MFYIGVDIAKSFNVTYIVNEKDKVIKSLLKFKNDKKGFEEFLCLLSSIDTDASNFIIKMEATGLFLAKSVKAQEKYLCYV